MIFIYTIWEARNRAIFRNEWTPTDISSAILIQKAQEHIVSPKSRKIRAAIVPVIDKSTLWEFFYEASQGEPTISGAGGVIHLYETHKISFKLGLGRATNSKAEISMLWATLNIAKDKQIDKLNIYGDSKIVIEWVQIRNNIIAPHLQNLLRAIRSLHPSFETIQFNHIYREFNTEADTLSKMALAIQPGIIGGEVLGEGEAIMFYIPL